jgi:hypothetical protein
MKLTTTLKALNMLGLTSLMLVATTASQADNGAGNYGNYRNPNPWLNNQANQQARYVGTVKERAAKLDQRQDLQMQRILAGMETGKLTMNEAISLLREHLAISRLERNYMADGRLGPNELSDLERRLDEANRHIVFEKNDREQNGPVGYPNMGRPGGMGFPGDTGRR